MKNISSILILLVAISSCNIFDGDSPFDLGDSKIVLALKSGDNEYQIYSMTSKGSELNRILGFDGHGIFTPSWSPDGKQIVFTTTYLATTAGPSIFIINFDGSNLHPMFQNSEATPPAPGSNPYWSPDGNKIVYDYCNNCEVGGKNRDVYLYDFETNAITNITSHPHSDSNPRWSPNGNFIAFNSTRDTSSFIADDIYLMNLNENSIERLTYSGNAGRHYWLGNNEEIIYWSENELYLMNVISRESRNIPVPVSEEIGFRPWGVSRDGNKILLHVFNYNNPQEEQSVQILDREQNKLTTITSGAQYSNGSWIILE